MNKDTFDLAIVNQFFDHDYHDRGMMKWQGFYLSDHTAALKRQKNKSEQQFSVKPQQSLSEIGKILASAYQKKQTVELQINIVDKNIMSLKTITTKILGYNAETIFIEDQKFIDLNTIQHIEKTVY